MGKANRKVKRKQSSDKAVDHHNEEKGKGEDRRWRKPNSWMWVSSMSGWLWNKGCRSHRVASINMGGLAVFSYTSSHLFLCSGSTLAVSYSLILLKPELRFLMPCPTCVHIIFMQPHPLSCVSEVWPYTDRITALVKMIISEVRFTEGLSILSTQLLSLKPKLERVFMRTENTKQQLHEIFKCAINGKPSTYRAGKQINSLLINWVWH